MFPRPTLPKRFVQHLRAVSGGAELLPEADLLERLLQAGLRRPLLQVEALPGRKLRWDLGWLEPGERLLVDVQGGQPNRFQPEDPGGKHNRRGGYESDQRKHNLAVIAGYRVLAFTPAMIESGEAVTTIAGTLATHPCFDVAHREHDKRQKEDRPA